MRKADIHRAAAEQLAMRGYPPGSYGWVRSGRSVVLRILTNPDAKLSKAGGDLSASCYLDLWFPVYTDKKGKTRSRRTNAALAGMLSVVPTIGSPKPVSPRAHPSTAMQMELV